MVSNLHSDQIQPIARLPGMTSLPIIATVGHQTRRPTTRTPGTPPRLRTTILAETRTQEPLTWMRALLDEDLDPFGDSHDMIAEDVVSAGPVIQVQGRRLRWGRSVILSMGICSIVVPTKNAHAKRDR